MEELIVELDQRYSVVVMCSSSATPFGDAAVLSRLADGVVVVVGEGSSRRQLGAALDALDVADAPIAGLVLQRGTR
jgi:Mrp family chromosome partitioning ATPase